MQHVVTRAKRGMRTATLAATGLAVALAASTGAVASAGSYHDSYTAGGQGQYRSSGSNNNQYTSSNPQQSYRTYTTYRWVYDSQHHCWDRVSTYSAGTSRYDNQQSNYSNTTYRYR